MTRNVAPTVSARQGTKLRLWIAAAALVLAGAAPALAGDRAALDVIGYSADGNYLAFEQYGVLDGSGDYYSSVFVLDIVADKWLTGVPFSARTEDSADPIKALADTRAQTRKAAGPLLEKFKIGHPVSIAALNGDGVPESDGKVLRFGQPMYLGVTGDNTLTLGDVEVPVPDQCKNLSDGPYLGFSLTVANEAGQKLVYADKSLPQSRNCPIGYSIYSVVYPLDSEGIPVAFVSIFTTGFEGPDRRFVAVPLGNL